MSYRTLKLQIPESPMRPHFVKARVKVHVYPDGSHALFHGPRCIGRYDEQRSAENDRRTEKRRLNPLGGEPWGRHGQASGLPTPPTGEQKQKKRTFGVLPKPDNFIRYRQIKSAMVASRFMCQLEEGWDSLGFVFVGEDGEEDAVH